jgi:hypothetical protein
VKSGGWLPEAAHVERNSAELLLQTKNLFDIFRSCCAVSQDIQAFCETVPFPKSDTIVVLGSDKAEFWIGIPKSAKNVMNSDEL